MFSGRGRRRTIEMENTQGQQVQQSQEPPKRHTVSEAVKSVPEGNRTPRKLSVGSTASTDTNIGKQAYSSLTDTEKM
jgi:hypothetical protein